MYRKIYRNMRILSLLTMVLTAILILSVCYTIFENRLKEEIRSETKMLAEILNGDFELSNIPELDNESENHRISVINREGRVIFDSFDSEGVKKNHLDREEVVEALQSGVGESHRLSDTMHVKLFYYALRLNNGTVLRISRVTQNNFILLLRLVLPMLFLLIFVYGLCLFVAVRLTQNITRPFEKINITDGEIDCVYDELKPFLNRIQVQQKEIKHQMDRVKMQKSRLQTISDNMGESLVVLDKNSNVLSLNQSALTIFEAEEEGILQRNFMYLCRNLSLREALEKTLNGEKNSVEFTLSDQHYQAFFSPVFENGEVSGAILLVFDMTARYEAEQIRREFSANVSHELKTPLTTILGYSQIINQGLARTEDIPDFVKKIEEESTRLIVLINDIIKISRLDHEENQRVQMQEIHLYDVAQDCIERLSGYARERNIAVQIEGDDVVIHGNIVQITELVYNLCENAIKYNRGGGQVTVILKPYRLMVSDTGIGIPKEYHERIFERFFRVDKSRSKNVGGTGLGLSIVKHITKCHHARIELESEINKGTCIAVVFQEENYKF